MKLARSTSGLTCAFRFEVKAGFAEKINHTRDCPVRIHLFFYSNTDR